MRSGSKKDTNGNIDKNNKKKIKYPIGPEFYTLYEEIGQGVSASVHRALCIPLNLIVAIKILDFERENCDLKSISREAQIMNLIDHPNVLKSMCSFVSDHSLWVVMPYMAGGSCLHVLKAAYPNGFEEKIIATILQEVLKGMEYLHHHGHIHRDVKAGNILIDSHGCVKLGDFGVSACLFDSGDRQRLRNTFVGTPCWMAPEVMEQLHGYDFKADMWSFGITALELAHGHAPFSKYPPMKVLLMTLQQAPPSLDEEGDKKFSRSFKQMISSCLVKDPSKRPTAKKLLKHYFFKQAKTNDYISRKLFEDMPPLGDRIRALKMKEYDMLAQKKMPDGKKEEISQNEYKRGISDWNFDLDDLKTQASMIPDDDVTCDKDMAESSNSLSTIDRHDRCSQFYNFSMDHFPEIEESMEENDLVDDMHSFAPHVSYLNNTRNGNHSSQCSSSSSNDHLRYNFSGKYDVDFDGGYFQNIPNSFHQQRNGNYGSSTSLSDFIVTSEKPMHDTKTQSSGWLDEKLQNEDHIEDRRRAQRTTQKNNGEKVEEKGMARVVQQKGRFKVTSEDVDLDKVVLLTTPVMQKSRSMQVIGLHNSSLPLLPNAETTSSNHSFLHLSTAQKGMMKSLKLRDRMWTEPAAD